MQKLIFLLFAMVACVYSQMEPSGSYTIAEPHYVNNGGDKVVVEFNEKDMCFYGCRKNCIDVRRMYYWMLDAKFFWIYGEWKATKLG